MYVSKMTLRGRTTVPKPVREAVNLREGDAIAFESVGDRIHLRKVAPAPDEYSSNVFETLGEWASQEDEEAWRDL